MICNINLNLPKLWSSVPSLYHQQKERTNKKKKIFFNTANLDIGLRNKFKCYRNRTDRNNNKPSKILQVRQYRSLYAGIIFKYNTNCSIRECFMDPVDVLRWSSGKLRNPWRTEDLSYIVYSWFFPEQLNSLILQHVECTSVFHRQHKSTKILSSVLCFFSFFICFVFNTMAFSSLKCFSQFWDHPSHYIIFENANMYIQIALARQGAFWNGENIFSF